jgi:transposase
MIKLTISNEDKEKIAVLRFEHPDIHVQRRLHALFFKALDYSHKAICELADISYTTLDTILKAYIEGGLEAVCRITYYTPRSDLDDHRQTIEEHFRNNPPATVADACKVIKELTGVERKETQVRKFLIGLGMRPRKAGAIPGKLDPEVQEEFKKKALSQNFKKQPKARAMSIS